MDNATTVSLFNDFGIRCRLDYDPEAPLPFAVWTLDADGDFEEIAGAGSNEREALDEARETLESWGIERSPEFQAWSFDRAMLDDGSGRGS